MIYRVTLLPRAKADLQRNTQWWAEHHSPEQAAHWLDHVHGQLESLQGFSERHSLSMENDQFPCEIRDKLVGLGPRSRYRAVFTIKGDEVFVLAVRAGEEDRLTPDAIDLPE